METKKENTLLKVIQEEKLKVGIMPDYAPWSSFSSEGSFEGYEVDIAKLLGEALGVNVELIAVDNSSRVASLISDKVDVIISCLASTNERAKVLAFSIPYASEGLLLMVKSENKDINSYADMAGKTIPVIRGSTADLYTTELFPDSEILRFDTNTDIYLAFKSGKADSLVEIDSYIYLELRNNPGKYKIVGEPFSKGLITMAVRQGDQEWLNYINNFITNFRFDGTNAALWKKWFGAEPTSLVLE